MEYSVPKGRINQSILGFKECSNSALHGIADGGNDGRYRPGGFRRCCWSRRGGESGRVLQRLVTALLTLLLLGAAPARDWCVLVSRGRLLLELIQVLRLLLLRLLAA